MFHSQTLRWRLSLGPPSSFHMYFHRFSLQVYLFHPVAGEAHDAVGLKFPEGMGIEHAFYLPYLECDGRNKLAGPKGKGARGMCQVLG